MFYALDFDQWNDFHSVILFKDSIDDLRSSINLILVKRGLAKIDTTIPTNPFLKDEYLK